ncbi:MAG: ZIP family magnesium transporter [Acidobacteria bacterium]|nr:MAG: ZIP family magnesium transporter [Acidobacteriota bacterium]
MSPLAISLVLGVVAGLANIFGGAIVSARPWSRTFLSYFIALGSGFMLATALTEMIPASLHLEPFRAPLMILLGYFIVHFFEHSWPAHFHFGEETHADQFLNPRVAYTAFGGLAIHTFFDGVAIASGFLISTWLGTVIFGAVILHNIPEGFTVASIMVAAQKRRGAGLWAATALGVSRIAGVLTMAATHRLVSYGLAVSGGVTLYVAASDLIPEVNKMRGSLAALVVAVWVVLVILLRLLLLGHAAP